MLNVLVVGLGHIARKHIEAIEKTGMKLYGVCDSMTSRMDGYDCLKFTDYRAALQDPNIDLVSICTPSWLHHSMVIQANQAGKLVLCEKPLALSSSSVRDIMRYADDLPIWVVMQVRFEEGVRYLEHLLDTGTLGDPYMVQINCFWNRDDAYFDSPWKGNKNRDGGTLFNQFSHYIDLITHLFGEVESVKCSTHNFNHPNVSFEDSGVAQFILKSGALVTLNFTISAWGGNFENSITVIGSNGNIRLEGPGFRDIRLKAPFSLDELDTHGPYGHEAVYHDVLFYQQSGNSILATPLEALKTTHIIEALYDSDETGEEVII